MNEEGKNEEMNGQRIQNRTKACKMAFFRTAGGADRTSDWEGARSREGLGWEALATQTKACNMADSRIPGSAQNKTGSRVR